VLAVSKVAATEQNQGFLHSSPFVTIAYTRTAVIFGPSIGQLILITLELPRTTNRTPQEQQTNHARRAIAWQQSWP
jgi:hypothetical protein